MFLFLIFVDDLEDGIKNMVYTFADDTEVLAQVQSEAERKSLQEGLDKLSEWTCGKCLSIHRSVKLCTWKGQIRGLSTLWKVRLWMQSTVT